jgi:hypothetical protein
MLGTDQDVKNIVHISTNIMTGCKHCSQTVGSDKFEESINHYIQVHGYKLLHVGQEHDTDMNGNSIHHTVAILGL